MTHHTTLQVRFDPSDRRQPVRVTGGDGLVPDGSVHATAPTDLVFVRANATDRFFLLACVVSATPIDPATLPVTPTLPYERVSPELEAVSIEFEPRSSTPSLTIRDRDSRAERPSYWYAVGVSPSTVFGPVLWSAPQRVDRDTAMTHDAPRRQSERTTAAARAPSA